MVKISSTGVNKIRSASIASQRFVSARLDAWAIVASLILNFRTLTHIVGLSNRLSANFIGRMDGIVTAYIQQYGGTEYFAMCTPAHSPDTTYADNDRHVKNRRTHWQIEFIGMATIKPTLEHQHMKRNSRMKRSTIGTTLAAMLLGTASLVSAAATTSDDAVVQNTGSTPYVSGGVGLDSIDKLTSITGNYNLKLIFALKSGDYLSNVKVAIADARGKSLLDTTSDGPWFLTKLPPGNYQVAATYGGATERRTVAVGTEKLRTVDFRWTSD